MPDDVALDKLQCKRSIGPADCERFHLDVSRIDRMTARFQPCPSEIAMQDYVPEAVTIIIEASTRGNESRTKTAYKPLIRDTENSPWLLLDNKTQLEIICQLMMPRFETHLLLWGNFLAKNLIFHSSYKIMDKNWKNYFGYDFIWIRRDYDHLNIRLHFEKNPLLNRLSRRWKINCIPINRLTRTADLIRESLRTKLLEIGPE